MHSMLTEMSCKEAEPREKIYRLNDRHGLYLEVKPSGAKKFRYRFKLGGKESMMALGDYPATSLTEARKKADAARKLVKEGLDPVRQKNSAQAAIAALRSLSDDEIALVQGYRAEKARREAARAFQRKAIATAHAFDGWLDTSGEGPTFAAFINTFGYQDSDGQRMYEAVKRIFAAALEVESDELLRPAPLNPDETRTQEAEEERRRSEEASAQRSAEYEQKYNEQLAQEAANKEALNWLNTTTAELLERDPERFINDLNGALQAAWDECKPVGNRGATKGVPTPLPVFSFREGGLLLSVGSRKTPLRLLNPMFTLGYEGFKEVLKPIYAGEAWSNAIDRMMCVFDTRLAQKNAQDCAPGKARDSRSEGASTQDAR